MLDRTQVVETLHGGICEVVFTKADGTERRMNCTLCKTFLPEDTRVLTESHRNVNPAVVAVWDTDASAWKSFGIESVKTFRKVSTYLNG